MLPWFERLSDSVPDLEPLDAHTHIGSNDPDGFRCSREQLVDALERIDARAFVFPMHEPDGYRAANDMVIDEAAASDGRLFPFCRLDPHSEDPLAEADGRSIAARAASSCTRAPSASRWTTRGSSGCSRSPMSGGCRCSSMQAVASCTRARCPAGHWAPPGAPPDPCPTPGSRICPGSGATCPMHPNLFFDTSWWSPADVQALIALVPPGQILMASDAPYGSPTWAAVMTTRNALQLGLDPDQARAIAGGQALRIVSGDQPLHLGPPPGGDRLPHDPLLDRVYSFLLSAIGQAFNGVEPAETIALVRLACDVGDDAPQAPVCQWVLELLDQRESYVARGRRAPTRFAPGMHFFIGALGIVRTPDVPLPEFRRLTAG